MALSPEVRPTAAVPPAAVSQYRERGWAVIPGVFSAAETDEISAVAMQVSAAELAASPGERFTVDASPDGELQPRKIDYPFLKHPAFRRFALDPRLAGIAAAFLGQDAYLIRDQLFCKPPRFGTKKPYHQENAALLFEPPGDMIVTWVALDPASQDNGCLRFIDGSHHELLEHSPVPGAPYHLVPDTSAVDMTRESVMPVGKGSVIVIHSQVLHGSAANHSSQWRRAYSCHWVTRRVTCGTSALAYGYSRTVGQQPYRHHSL
jgi:ectoine hydroxylase-related dioxygenase (phytanoyl-CoA dioxygenase family)